MLSKATISFPLSTRSHSPAHSATSCDFTTPLSRTRLPKYCSAVNCCISVPNPSTLSCLFGFHTASELLGNLSKLTLLRQSDENITILGLTVLMHLACGRSGKVLVNSIRVPMESAARACRSNGREHQSGV